jgi:hypothetical protein
MLKGGMLRRLSFSSLSMSMHDCVIVGACVQRFVFIRHSAEVVYYFMTFGTVPLGLISYIIFELFYLLPEQLRICHLVMTIHIDVLIKVLHLVHDLVLSTCMFLLYFQTKFCLHIYNIYTCSNLHL